MYFIVMVLNLLALHTNIFLSAAIVSNILYCSYISVVSYDTLMYKYGIRYRHFTLLLLSYIILTMLLSCSSSIVLLTSLNIYVRIPTVLTYCISLSLLASLHN